MPERDISGKAGDVLKRNPLRWEPPAHHEPQTERIGIRLTLAEREAIEELYIAGYREHRLSRNAWYIKRLLGEPHTPGGL